MLAMLGISEELRSASSLLDTASGVVDFGSQVLHVG